jgi:hypothetical protein
MGFAFAALIIAVGADEYSAALVPRYPFVHDIILMCETATS